MGRLAALVVLLSAGAALAGWQYLVGKEPPELGAVQWSRPVEGDTLADLEGRMVLVMFLEAGKAEGKVFERLGELDAVYGEEGLVVLGVTRGGKIEGDPGFPVGTAGEKAAGWGSGKLPYGYLVAPGGKVSWEGKLRTLPDLVLQKLARKHKPFHLRSVADPVEEAAAAFRKGDLAEAEAKARAALAALGEDDPALKDASYVVDRVVALKGCWQRVAAAAREEGNYVRAEDRLHLLAKAFAGTPVADQADQDLGELKADPAAKRDLTSFKAYLRLYAERIRAGENKKKKDALVKKLKKLIDRYGGTRAAVLAERMRAGIEDDPAVAALKAFIARERIDTSGSSWKTSLKKPPQVEFVPGRTYYWDLVTNQGAIRIRLFPDVAPMHVSSTIYLTLLGYFDGLTFHRVITGFMAQGGCPKGDGRGRPGYVYDGEFSDRAKHDRAGIVSTANSGPGTDGSQFFITFRATPKLDGLHTVFGVVVSGMDTVRRLEERGSEGGTPTERLEIKKASIAVE